MLDFFVIIVIGSSIGCFWARTRHNRYGLSHLLNGLIGLVVSLLDAPALPQTDVFLLKKNITNLCPAPYNRYIGSVPEICQSV